jgi:hypothetical protein
VLDRRRHSFGGEAGIIGFHSCSNGLCRPLDV